MHLDLGDTFAMYPSPLGTGMTEAEADAADAELEKELWTRVNELKEKAVRGRKYLADLKDAGDRKAEDLKKRVAELLD